MGNRVCDSLKWLPFFNNLVLHVYNIASFFYEQMFIALSGNSFFILLTSTYTTPALSSSCLGYVFFTIKKTITISTTNEPMHYPTADADIKQLTDHLKDSIERDMADFNTHNITDPEVAAFATLIEAFSNFSTGF